METLRNKRVLAELGDLGVGVGCQVGPFGGRGGHALKGQMKLEFQGIAIGHD